MRPEGAKRTKVRLLNVGDYLAFRDGSIHQVIFVLKLSRYERQIHFSPNDAKGNSAYSVYGRDYLYRLPKRIGMKLYREQLSS